MDILDKKVYIIGGSPCSGKSTVAEILAEKYNLFYYKVDDFLDDFIESAAKKGYAICEKISRMSPDEIWMRNPMEQCEEELMIYNEIFDFVLDGINQLEYVGIITEGAAYLPELMNRYQISKQRYMAITPSADFQISHYKKREWVPYVLEGCHDKEVAFANWMNRDILFAKEVQAQCDDYGYLSFLNDGSISIEDMVARVEANMQLQTHLQQV